jgi:hypothetical protein
LAARAGLLARAVLAAAGLAAAGLAAAGFRPAARLAVRFLLRAPRADALPPARLFDGVRFCPFVERDFEEPAAFRRDAFLAMVLTPVW